MLIANNELQRNEADNRGDQESCSTKATSAYKTEQNYYILHQIRRLRN